jgi:hypothetical protein
MQGGKTPCNRPSSHWRVGVISALDLDDTPSCLHEAFILTDEIFRIRRSVFVCRTYCTQGAILRKTAGWLFCRRSPLAANAGFSGKWAQIQFPSQGMHPQFRSPLRGKSIAICPRALPKWIKDNYTHCLARHSNGESNILRCLNSLLTTEYKLLSSALQL